MRLTRRDFVKFTGIGISTFLGMSLLGCTKKETFKDTLVIGYADDLKLRGDPAKIDRSIPKFCVLERLIEYDLSSDDFVPSLAKKWEIENDGKRIVFELRKGILFSDGTEMDANAVKFTYDILVVRKHSVAPKSVEVIDDYTVAFNFDEAWVLNFAKLQDVHGLGVMSPKSVEPEGDPNGTLVNLIGTGPFKVVEYVENQYTVLEPNRYWFERTGLEPKIKKLIVKVIPDEDTRVLALRSGEVDVLIDNYHGGYDYTPRNQLSALKRDGFKVLTKNIPYTWIVAFNYKKEPFNDVEMRWAVNYAINRDEIAKIFDEWVRPAWDGMFPPEAPGMAEANVRYEYYLEKARDIVSGKDVGEIKFIVDNSQSDQVLVAQLVQQQLKDVGLNVKLETLERGVYRDRVRSGDYDLRIYYIGGSERTFYMRIFWRFLPPEKPWKVYMSDNVTEKAMAVVKEFDKTKRRQKFVEFYKALYEEAGVAPLYYEVVAVVEKPNVEGVKFEYSEPRFYSAYVRAYA